MFSKADDPNVPMAPTPAIEGVDHNGLVVGKWKNGLFGSCYMNCVPNGVYSSHHAAILSRYLDGADLRASGYRQLLRGSLLLFVSRRPRVRCCSDQSRRAEYTRRDLGALVMLFTIRIRFRMRYLFSIPGSLVEDIFSSVFCCCCAVAQMADHSESFEPNTFAILPRATLPGYTFG
ncbi:PLAC8 family [Phytophthora infestans]|uniref:PLAC8 family n=1 Tax=Phytophthora infestans TaxID=4787 RepID=A0A833VZH2_PHYIN|nr:PLAC8 family [Phytophthora infestans]KAF4133355.1 PLAC8 family [Phytophthora infestans]